MSKRSIKPSTKKPTRTKPATRKPRTPRAAPRAAAIAAAPASLPQPPLEASALERRDEPVALEDLAPVAPSVILQVDEFAATAPALATSIDAEVPAAESGADRLELALVDDVGLVPTLVSATMERPSSPDSPAALSSVGSPPPPADEILEHAFFHADVDSIPPVVEPEPLAGEPERTEIELSPAARARRARMRKAVGLVLGVAGILTAAVIGKTLLSGKPAVAAPSHAAAAQAALASNRAERQMPLVRTRLPGARSLSEAVAGAFGALEQPEAESEPRIEPEPAAAPEPAADTSNPALEAQRLLERGKAAESIPLSQAAIARDPSNAFGYLLLGAGWQGLGKGADALEAYSECARNATRGAVQECRALGGRK
jgi:hypothetical protein